MYGRIAQATLMIEHRHNDGSWGRLERAHHDVTAHDPEREWAEQIGPELMASFREAATRIAALEGAPTEADGRARAA